MEKLLVRYVGHWLLKDALDFYETSILFHFSNYYVHFPTRSLFFNFCIAYFAVVFVFELAVLQLILRINLSICGPDIINLVTHSFTEENKFLTS